MAARRTSKKTAVLAVLAGLLLPSAVLADVQATAGPCRLKLRSGRIMEAKGLEPADEAGAFWRILLGGGSALVVPLREVRAVEPLRAAAIAAAIVEAEAEADAAPEDAELAEASCNPATDARIRRWDSLIEASSARHGVDVDLVRAIVAVESCGNPKAVSRKGAVGLMQLMPKTASDYGCEDPRDPGANVEAGCRHLARLQARLGGELELVLAAYNAGEGTVQRSKGVPRFKETKSYVKSVLAHLAGSGPS